MTLLDFIKTPAFALAVIFILAAVYSIYAKIRDSKATKNAAPVADKQVAEKAPVAVTTAAGVSCGELDLVDTDEKTAAVIMALVSYKSGIPLNRLSFKSIRLMEDK